MKLKFLSLFGGVLLSFSAASAANVDRALDRVQDACGISYRTKSIVRHNVKTNSAKLIGNMQSFVHKDGRLIMIDLDNRCSIDQIRIDEGPITHTKAIGKRLFMVVKNSLSGKGRLYMAQAYDSNRQPYKVFEVKYSSRGSYAQADRLRVINKRGQRASLQVIKKNGKAYKRIEQPSTWGYYNNASHVRDRIEEIEFVDLRTKRYASVHRSYKRQYVLLPTPVCSGISISFEYLFGLVREELVVGACI
jgi:hypothetical protein